ncbi:hypothetical protein ACJX0J_012076 [Zea mays]
MPILSDFLMIRKGTLSNAIDLKIAWFLSTWTPSATLKQCAMMNHENMYKIHLIYQYKIHFLSIFLNVPDQDESLIFLFIGITFIVYRVKLYGPGQLLQTKTKKKKIKDWEACDMKRKKKTKRRKVVCYIIKIVIYFLLHLPISFMHKGYIKDTIFEEGQKLDFASDTDALQVTMHICF